MCNKNYHYNHKLKIAGKDLLKKGIIGFTPISIKFLVVLFRLYIIAQKESDVVSVELLVINEVATLI